MQQFVVNVLVVAAIFAVTCSKKDNAVVKDLEISSLGDVANTSLDESGYAQALDYHLQNKLRGGKDKSIDYAKFQVNIKRCIRLIAQNGLERTPECRRFLDAAIAYCRDQLQRAGGTQGDRIPCSQMLAAVIVVRNTCTLPQKRPRQACNDWLPPAKRRRGKCKAGELFGQIPGSSLEPRCFDASKKSDTQPLPLRLFERENTISSNTKKVNIGDLLVQVYTIPIGQGDCNIITCNGGKNVILFDCGSSAGNNFKKKNKKYKLIHSPFDNAESISILISHGHADHHNMIRKVLNSNVVTIPPKGKVTVILGGKEGDYSKALRTWLKGITAKVKILTGRKRENLCSNADIWFDLVPGNVNSRNVNEKGMLMKLHCNTCKSSLLFTGDMEGPTAKAFGTTTDSDTKSFLRATHYKMAHHGAATLANGEDWLKAIMPVEVHVSHRYDGRFHHPRCEAMNRLMTSCKVGVTSGIPIAQPHDLTCFGEKSERFKAYEKRVYHRVFSTAPRKDKVCLIVVNFRVSQEAITDYYCGSPRDIS